MWKPYFSPHSQGSGQACARPTRTSRHSRRSSCILQRRTCLQGDPQRPTEGTCPSQHPDTELFPIRRPCPQNPDKTPPHHLAHHPHSTEGETEAHRRSRTCPRSRSQEGAKTGQKRTPAPSLSRELSLPQLAPRLTL